MQGRRCCAAVALQTLLLLTPMEDRSVGLVSGECGCMFRCTALPGRNGIIAAAGASAPMQSMQLTCVNCRAAQRSLQLAGLEKQPQKRCPESVLGVVLGVQNRPKTLLRTALAPRNVSGCSQERFGAPRDVLGGGPGPPRERPKTPWDCSGGTKDAQTAVSYTHLTLPTTPYV